MSNAVNEQERCPNCPNHCTREEVMCEMGEMHFKHLDEMKKTKEAKK